MKWIGIIALICVCRSNSLATDNIDTTNKNAWAENAGWVNAAPTNAGATVHFDGTSGYMKGYVWGENIGWIKMGADAGGPYNNNSATDWGVNMSASGDLSGYAWGENVGWIKFSSSFSTVVVDTATGQFSGEAWGENIGWVRFKGAAPDYNVRTIAFDTQAQGTPNWWLVHYNVTESYDDGDSMSAWQEYLADTDPTDPDSYFSIAAISNTPMATVYFSTSSRRRYTLQRCDCLTSPVWSNVVSQVSIQGTGGLDSLQDVEEAPLMNYRINVGL